MHNTKGDVAHIARMNMSRETKCFMTCAVSRIKVLRLSSASVYTLILGHFPA